MSYWNRSAYFHVISFSIYTTLEEEWNSVILFQNSIYIFKENWLELMFTYIKLFQAALDVSVSL